MDTDPTATVATDDLLHLYWLRVQEPNGTTNMDFEFNQLSTPSANGVTPVRTAGDLLIQYDLSQGGVNPVLFVSRWVTTGATSQCEASNTLPCWGDKSSLTASGDATGSINTAPIPVAQSDGLATTNPISPRTFGEATVNFSSIVGEGKCVSFGSAYLKSRSSDSFTSALKDFIAPVATPELSNCAKVIIHKQTVPDGATQSFAYTSVIDVEGTTADNPSFNLADGGTKTIENVLLGSNRSVTETHPLASGWVLSSIDCSASVGVTPSATNLTTGTVTFSLDDSSDVLECTYTNTLQTGSLLIVKERKHVASNDSDPTTTDETHPHSGVAFTVSDLNPATPDIPATTGADGTICVGNLLVSSIVGAYTVTETVPTGYVSDDPSKDVTVLLGDGCGGTADSQRVEFLNTPLTNFTVSVDSQIPGGTASTIDCDAAADPPFDKTTDATGDGSFTKRDLPPGTYTCVIVIDP